jgi:hypothetical protein
MPRLADALLQSKTRYEVGPDHLPELAIPTGLMKLVWKGHATLVRTHVGRTRARSEQRYETHARATPYTERRGDFATHPAASLGVG